MRDCSKVIAEMINKVPETETDLLEALRWNLEDASYKAPEETIQWHRTQSTLIEHIPTPKEDWEFEVLSIFTTMSIDDLRASVK